MAALRGTSAKYWITGGIVAAAAAVAVILAVGPARAEQPATLRILDGSVSVAQDGGSFVAAVDGMSLESGDVVRTGNPGRAAITYFDGSETRLDSDTTFTVAELATI